MKRLAGTPNPRSWKETKLSTYPDDGVGGAIHSGCGSPERGRSKPSATRASRSSTVTVEKGHGSHGGTTVTRSAITKRRRWRRSGQGARFSFSDYSLRLRKPKQEASSRIKNHHWSLFRIYKGPGKTRSTLRLNPPRNSKLEGETPVPRTARATAAPRTTRPVALTPRQGRRHLWQAKRATLHLRHDDRVKKGVPRCSISYPFPLPLSLSLATGTGKGDTSKGILLHEGSGARALLLIRGSKAGPSEGFDSCLRALGLCAHYWSEVRRLAPRKGSTTASGHSGSAPTTDQGFEGWPPEGFDSRLRTRRERDDSGYVRYMAEARATLPRYPRTFPRPAEAIL
jgi:hypothetical protein